MLIAPSLLSANFLRFEDEVRCMEAAGADWLHFDVMDGQFVPNLTFGPKLLGSIKAVSNLPLDVHLMTINTQHIIPLFIEAGADHIAFHPETCPHPYRELQKIKDANKKAGIVIKPGLSFEAMKPLVEVSDIVILMTVNPGFSGQSFIHHMCHEIEKLKTYIVQNGLSTLLEVDGGINLLTAKQAKDAGGDALVVGYGIFGKTGGRTLAEYQLSIEQFKKC
jgi:ribulose-phosphate 3-epimerase